MPSGGKVFINALSQGKWYRFLFGGIIAFLLVLNLIFYFVYIIRSSQGILSQDQVDSHRTFLLLTALCSTVMIGFLLVIYFQFRNTTVLIGKKGIAYLSLLRKIRAEWDNVIEIQIQERQQGEVLFISTRYGSFLLGPQFVDRDEPKPEFRFRKNRLLMIDNKRKLLPIKLEKTDIYKTISTFAGKKIKIRRIITFNKI